MNTADISIRLSKITMSDISPSSLAGNGRRIERLTRP
jgi:hypothetical protein